jgi:hypothetical protein
MTSQEPNDILTAIRMSDTSAGAPTIVPARSR